MLGVNHHTWLNASTNFRSHLKFLIAATATLIYGTAGAFVIQQPEVPLAVGDEYTQPSGSVSCNRTLTAEVVSIDQVLFYNRMNVFMAPGNIYALKRDVVPVNGSVIGPGNARLRDDKRPRPVVLRMNKGDCLEVTYTNLLAPVRADNNQAATRSASIMIDGLSLVGSIASSGSNVGQNVNSLALPGETRVYTWYASEEGPFYMHTAGAMTGGEGDGGMVAHGMFGVVNVEPEGSVWYRSQVTTEELDFATSGIDGNGNRQMNYDAVYPAGHAFEGKPVLKILDGLEIFHSDLNAVIAGIPPGSFPEVTAAAPDNNGIAKSRDDPFREFTIVYHDENELVQAFPVLSQEFFAHSIRDNMAINYGTGGIGAEIISYGAAQIQTGPFGSPHIPAGNSFNCNDCKYEEAFLSAWAVGDPAMVFVRAPVQDPCGAVPTPGCTPPVLGQALEALYPDDPSNVHHSYLNDHVKMRLVHGGVNEHHIHHLHAHQWLHSQNSDNSTYFDSQALGPGAAYTLDIVYNGGGNRNKTVGDSIFHCHFYPHFAEGMWELWRVHDVFEDGTRTLPDAELPAGTPIPALVPLPTQAMAPPPTAAMPGYPFYIPGIAGHRPPHPPLDTVDDGGLPRHVVRSGTVLDGRRGPFDREHVEMDALLVPEAGTPEEQAAMAFHAQRFHSSVTPEGNPATFITNGLPPIAGAPYADPCVDDDGNPVNLGNERVIKAAVVQIDAIINKVGWHFPQTRLITLWGDVADTQSGARPPEPFFIRANSNDCITYYHTNLVPGFYDVDDFQVFTPTDIIGQHIHLVKFDVTSSDGSGNGWNYEDGTFSPDEVIERIEAINAAGGLDQGGGNRVLLEAEAHPYFGVLGAQTTIQRWWADPLLNAQGKDRTIRTVFTHDHFGPSTHQQVGLYAGLLIEPTGSTWRNPESGQLMGGRFDGGPTSWRADILTADPADSHREFMLEFQDFHLAYTADNVPVNPPGRIEVGLPFLVAPPPVPMPEGISADDVGTFSVNYRNEPIALRVRDPNGSIGGSNGVQAAGLAGDLAAAYDSAITRADPAFNVQPTFYPPLTNDVRARDPFTPLMRTYEGDKVVVRTLTGATEEGHNMTIHGMRWLHEPDDPTSGYNNSQVNGISEHFELEVGQLPEVSGFEGTADFLYLPGASVDDQWNGMWGLLREYEGTRGDLLPLPNNLDGQAPNRQSWDFQTSKKICPYGAPVRYFTVLALRAKDVLGNDGIVYNQGHNLHDPTGLIYVRESDTFTDFFGNIRLKSSAPREPLILRANAGDCIKVTLKNRFKFAPSDIDGYNMYPPIIDKFNANQVVPSPYVGLHPQMLDYDMRTDNGVNVGQNTQLFNPSTAAMGQNKSYEWYAGKVEIDHFGNVHATPIEFGATNLVPADLLQHSHKGLAGALIIEPKGSSWSYPVAMTRATADVSYPGGSFREFVMIINDDIQMLMADDSLLPNLHVPGVFEDAEDTGNSAVNYRTEPIWTRIGYDPSTPLQLTRDFDFTDALSLATGPIETPLFEAPVGTKVRFRVLEAQGHARNHVISVHGHMWRHEPGNPNGDWIGSQDGHGPSGHLNFIPKHGAGGAMGVPGDYLYRERTALDFDEGLWGVFRVTP